MGRGGKEWRGLSWPLGGAGEGHHGTQPTPSLGPRSGVSTQ